MMTYTKISVIYNPNSTGSSKELARQFKKELLAKLPKQSIELIATDHAGHGEELAYEIATSQKKPLIISASGDGGYNEVVNGALKAQKEGAHPATGLLPAGNANDHYHNVHDKSIVDMIVDGDEKQIDVLQIQGMSNGEKLSRYAHSYIGLGVTPHVAKELNKTKLNVFNQIVIVAKALLSSGAVKLVIDNEAHHYDSLIFSNIDKMSKVLKISQPSRISDGKFEVTIFRKRNKLRLIAILLQASITGVKEDTQAKRFDFTTVRRTLVQLDGEIITLDAGSQTKITIDKQLLRCVV